MQQMQQEPSADEKPAMKGNWPWILMVLANLIFWIAWQRNTNH